MSLTIHQVEHLAKLAKIQLTQEEKEKYTKDLSSILGFVEKLQEVKIEDQRLKIKDQKPKINELDNEGQLREDEVIGVSSLEQNELINSAPETNERLIKTKAVFE